MPLKKKKATKAKKARILKKIIRKKKVIKRRPARPAAPVKKVKAKENVIGQVTHYFPHVQAAVVKLKAPLSVGDTIKVKGHTTDFTQAVVSMQINHVPVNQAKKGEEIGLLVNSRVRQHDAVYKA